MIFINAKFYLKMLSDTTMKYKHTKLKPLQLPRTALLAMLLGLCTLCNAAYLNTQDAPSLWVSGSSNEQFNGCYKHGTNPAPRWYGDSLQVWNSCQAPLWYENGHGCCIFYRKSNQAWFITNANGNSYYAHGYSYSNANGDSPDRLPLRGWNKAGYAQRLEGNDSPPGLVIANPAEYERVLQAYLRGRTNDELHDPTLYRGWLGPPSEQTYTDSQLEKICSNLDRSEQSWWDRTVSTLSSYLGILGHESENDAAGPSLWSQMKDYDRWGW